MGERHTIAQIQVRSDSLVAYWLPADATHRRKAFNNFLNPTYSGKVSNHVKKRIISATDLLIQRANFRAIQKAKNRPIDDPNPPKMIMNFVTLTLAEQKNLEVRECYDRLLRPWLRYMKDKQGLKDYVWKAEYQKRGQVHYHLAADVYMDWKVVRWKWNQLQRENRMLDGFAQKYGHFNPNGTDVHPMHSVTNAMEYLAKEMCKDVQNQKTTKGKVWDCSNSLKVGRFAAEMTTYNEAMIDDAIQMGFAEKIEADRCVIIKLKEPTRILTPEQLAAYQNHIH